MGHFSFLFQRPSCAAEDWPGPPQLHRVWSHMVKIISPWRVFPDGKTFRTRQDSWLAGSWSCKRMSALHHFWLQVYSFCLCWICDTDTLGSLLVLDRAMQSHSWGPLWQGQNTSVAVSPHLPYLFVYLFIDRVWPWIPAPPVFTYQVLPTLHLAPWILYLYRWQRFWSLNPPVWYDILSHV